MENEVSIGICLVEFVRTVISPLKRVHPKQHYKKLTSEFVMFLYRFHLKKKARNLFVWIMPFFQVKFVFKKKHNKHGPILGERALTHLHVCAWISKWSEQIVYLYHIHINWKE